ncbi:general secretion pathway protein GspB [Aliiglaciecola sp. CAU 1673]|uniref:general secretion pathway protein GspB n=1 Tax=Aliiglaciecola sp. CAU 1673 TaxID=3032595 RepID=UPI0023DB8790|nr:general secretion pathway protein GspB [Aliiglaciecola sp. CAU 1673]MDF2177462.1 general secretion pathway protein GspB [Aliiglaciecola sp. CAU 1673]
MAERVSIDALKPGMVILQIAAQNGPVKIRKSGLVTSEAMVHGLREMGVSELIIDPAQTVELETSAPVAPKSTHTRTLLRRDSGHKPLDNQLSEQFNRSLFMPSVQSLPGPWRYYGKRALTGAMVLIGGFALGWTGATYEQWRGIFESKPVVEVAATPAANNVVNVQDALPAPANSSPVDQLPATSPDTETAVPAKRLVSIPNGEAEVEGDVLNTPAKVPSTQDISPELMQKFREAVIALDEEMPLEKPVRERPATMETSDVVSVDQLPAWVQADLPSLSFSAHMYASEAADRWVRVNGMALGEGDWITDNLRILRIEPQQVVLLFKGQEFSMAALTDW